MKRWNITFCLYLSFIIDCLFTFKFLPFSPFLPSAQHDDYLLSPFEPMYFFSIFICALDYIEYWFIIKWKQMFCNWYPCYTLGYLNGNSGLYKNLVRKDIWSWSSRRAVAIQLVSQCWPKIGIHIHTHTFVRRIIAGCQVFVLPSKLQC